MKKLIIYGVFLSLALVWLMLNLPCDVDTPVSSSAFVESMQTEVAESKMIAPSTQKSSSEYSIAKNQFFFDRLTDSLLIKNDINTVEIVGQQVIIVIADGSSAKILAYEYDDELLEWKEIINICDGYVGKNGTCKNKQEGDYCTPIGIFNLSSAFGIASNPGTSLPYKIITQDSYWIDDPLSPFYNTWVEGTDYKDWNSAEHLVEYKKQYKYAIVIDYNVSPIIPNAGSAIFLHCGNKPTAGCVAADEEEIVEILQWLDPTKNPQIIILDANMSNK